MSLPMPAAVAADNDPVYQLTELEMQATADQAESDVVIRRWPGLVFFLLVLMGFSWFFSSIGAYLTDASRMPMAELIIQGQRQYVSDDEIRAVLLDKAGMANYFSVDVNSIQAKIESLPWVYHASVRKSWPDRLRVYIQEQPVIAIWNDNQLLNEDGVVFNAAVSKAPKSLVKLYSPDDRIAQLLSKYRKLSVLLQINDYTIVNMTLNLRNALTIELNNGIILRLGREDAVSRIQRYIDYVAVLDKDNIDYIDLRYDTGFAVGWKNDNKE